MALRLLRTLHGPAERRPDAPARQSQRGTVSVHGQRERLHPPIATAIHQHQFLAARVKHLDPEIPTQDDALRVPQPVERDTGHHGAVGIADFQIQLIAPAVKRQGRSRVGRQAEGGDGGDPKERACEKQRGLLPGMLTNKTCPALAGQPKWALNATAQPTPKAAGCSRLPCLSFTSVI